MLNEPMQVSITSPVSLESDQPINASQLSRLIKDRAFAEGFEKVGIVPASALDQPRDQLLTWLDRGYHGTMSWMARDPEQRVDPKKLFPPAKSVVVVAKNYYTPSQHRHD